MFQGNNIYAKSPQGTIIRTLLILLVNIHSRYKDGGNSDFGIGLISNITAICGVICEYIYIYIYIYIYMEPGVE